jgi:hypothetical protein
MCPKHNNIIKKRKRKKESHSVCGIFERYIYGIFIEE